MGSRTNRAEGWGIGWDLDFPVSLVRVRFLLWFLTGGWGPYYDRLGRFGAWETDI